jgi:hypothetical protein
MKKQNGIGDNRGGLSVRLACASESESVIRLFEGIALAENWQPGDQQRPCGGVLESVRCFVAIRSREQRHHTLARSHSQDAPLLPSAGLAPRSRRGTAPALG